VEINLEHQDSREPGEPGHILRHLRGLSRFLAEQVFGEDEVDRLVVVFGELGEPLEIPLGRHALASLPPFALIDQKDVGTLAGTEAGAVIQDRHDVRSPGPPTVREEATDGVRQGGVWARCGGDVTHNPPP
jgi:hypothetical protein